MSIQLPLSEGQVNSREASIGGMNACNDRFKRSCCIREENNELWEYNLSYHAGCMGWYSFA